MKELDQFKKTDHSDLKMEKFYKYNIELNELFIELIREYDVVIKNSNKTELPKNKIIGFLLLKSLFINKTTIDLLEQKEVISTAYLIRGQVEILADLNFIINNKSYKYIKRFIDYYSEIIIKNNELNKNVFEDKKYKNINKEWIKEESISNRIKKLMPVFNRIYDRLCYFVHSSPYFTRVIIFTDKRNDEAIKQLGENYIIIARLFFLLIENFEIDKTTVKKFNDYIKKNSNELINYDKN